MLDNFHFHKKLKNEILASSSTVLDLGSGKESPIKDFSKKLKYSLGVDNYLPYIEQSKKLKIHNKYLYSDILRACKDMSDNSFDCVIALDVIEHLNKENGKKLMKEMERIARKETIIYTPNKFLSQKKFDGNIKQEHLSGWSVNDMKRVGYKVFGMSGFKFLRGGKGEVRYKPNFLWQKISSATQIVSYFFPITAFQLFCVKKINQ